MVRGKAEKVSQCTFIQVLVVLDRSGMLHAIWGNKENIYGRSSSLFVCFMTFVNMRNKECCQHYTGDIVIILSQSSDICDLWLTLVWSVFFNPHCDNVGAILIWRVDIPENKLQFFTYTWTKINEFCEISKHKQTMKVQFSKCCTVWTKMLWPVRLTKLDKYQIKSLTSYISIIDEYTK